MNTTRLLLVLFALPSLAASLAVATPDLAALEQRIEHGALRGDAALVNATIADLDAALTADAQSPALLYLRGLAEYAAANASRATNDETAATGHLEQAAKLLERVKGGAPWAPEAAGLASSIYGQLIGLKGGVAAMTLGPKSGDLLAEAARGAPQSPRVLYFRGVSKFNTPAQWGGNQGEGIKLLQQAVDAFAAQDAAATGPKWGHAEALTWLGLAKQKLGDVDAARAAWTQALVLEPEYAWVKYVLLPSVKQG